MAAPSLPTYIKGPNHSTYGLETLSSNWNAGEWRHVSKLGVTEQKRKIQITQLERNCFLALCDDYKNLKPETRMTTFAKLGVHTLPWWANYYCIETTDANILPNRHPPPTTW